MRIKFKVLKSSFVPSVKKNQNGSSVGGGGGGVGGVMDATTDNNSRWQGTPDTTTTTRWQMFDHSAFIADAMQNEVIHSTFSSTAPEKVVRILFRLII